MKIIQIKKNDNYFEHKKKQLFTFLLFRDCYDV